MNGVDFTALATIQRTELQIEKPKFCGECIYGIRYPGYCERNQALCGCAKKDGVKPLPRYNIPIRYEIEEVDNVVE